MNCIAWTLFLWSVLSSTCLGQLNVAEYSLTCGTGEYKITSTDTYEDLGRDCAELIGDIPDNSHPHFVSECRRWMGDGHPSHVNGYYVTFCQAQSDGRLKYRADVCCQDEDEMRCFECTDFTSSSHCRDSAQAVKCSSGQVCQTTASYHGAYPTSNQIRDTECAAQVDCETQSDANSERCQHWAADPGCVYCCNTRFCNHYPPQGPHLHLGDSACLSNPCRNGGTCVPDDPAREGYTCSCTTNYTGYQCQTSLITTTTTTTTRAPRPCDPRPCQNGGYCVNTGSDYSCRCPQGWHGKDCQLPYQSCSGNDAQDFCLNGGTCIDHGSFGWRCKCPPDFVGSRCEFSGLQCVGDNPVYSYSTCNICHFGNTNCTTKIINIQKDLKDSYELNRCRSFMKQPDKPYFDNNVHGFVEELESRSYEYCDKGDEYGNYRENMCCPSCYSMPCMNGAWCVQGQDKDYICKCRYGWAGKNCDEQRHLCIISGDPHYQTFDGALIHFQGKKCYELSSSGPGLDHIYRVEGENEKISDGQGNRPTILKALIVSVCGHEIYIGRDHVTIDDEVVDPADDVQYDCFSLGFYGTYTRLETDFNLVVEFDGLRTGYVQIPSGAGFENNIQGLCGNFDGDPNTDYFDRNGTDHVNKPNRDNKVGKGWKCLPDDLQPRVDEEPFPTPECPDISHIIDSKDFCGLLLNMTGTFQTCLSDPDVNTVSDVMNCRYDVCANRDFEAEMKMSACAALHAFTVKCEAAGHVFTWRDESGCPLACPDGLIFKESIAACHATCRFPDAPDKCHLPNRESCVCPDGYILRNNTCIEPQQCGCVDNFGNHFKIGDNWISEDCMTQFTCEECTSCVLPVGQASGSSHTCLSHQQCELHQLGMGACVTAPRWMPITTVNGIKLSDEPLTVKVGEVYEIETLLPENATSAQITLYKSVDGFPDAFVCENARQCIISVKFDQSDTSAENITIGSDVDFGHFTEHIETECDILAMSAADTNSPIVFFTAVMFALALTLFQH